MSYSNYWKKMGTDDVVREFVCTCPPSTSQHERMVMGALRNANLNDYWLDDGNPANEPVLSGAEFVSTPSEPEKP